MTRGYHDHARPDVLQLVPEDAQRILDIGCGSGRLGAALKERQTCHVTGIEINAPACLQAGEVLDLALCWDVEQSLPSAAQDKYDCIICADVLEHLRNPEALLHDLRLRLAPGGCLVASVPNSRNRQVVEALIRGNYSYAEAGLLDRTHLRLFTRRELQRMLVRCGYETAHLAATLEPGLKAVPAGCGVDCGRLHVACESEAEAAEFYAYQYLARATVAPPAPGGRVSVIIPVWNQLDYTRQCLQSLRATAPDAESIVIDNGSTDATAEYLAAQTGLQVLSNADNLGWVRAVNQGLAAATGDTLILLNNDTILPDGWLRPLLDALWTEGVGLAGPVSNNVSAPQQVRSVYRTRSELEDWAWDTMQGNRGKLYACPRLVGFCLAARREVIAQIGGLDEQFGIGMFDDDDLCRRAAAAGWQTVIAAGSFVHHFGSVSFKALGAGVTSDLLNRNAQLMREKWEA